MKARDIPLPDAWPDLLRRDPATLLSSALRPGRINQHHQADDWAENCLLLHVINGVPAGTFGSAE
jgi:hypothetical protein